MILGTICCRGGSKGVPGKNTRLLHGKPLLLYTLEAAKQCRLIDDFIVSTDDPEIAALAQEWGAKVPFMRPAALATDEASKWPVFLHAVEAYEQWSGHQVDYLVDMDVTVPLKVAEDIDGAIRLALDFASSADVVITGYQSDKNPYFNMMQADKEGRASLVCPGSEPVVRRQDAPNVFSLSGAAFVLKKNALYNYAHWSQAPCRIYEIPRWRAMDIDTEFDLDLITCILSNNQQYVPGGL